MVCRFWVCADEWCGLLVWTLHSPSASRHWAASTHRCCWLAVFVCCNIFWKSLDSVVFPTDDNWQAGLALRTIPSIWTMKPPPTSSENANACVLFDSLLENDPNKSLKRKSTPGWKAVFHTEHYCMLCYTSTAHRVLENTAGSLQQSEQLHHLRWVKTRILRGCI